MVAVDHMPLGQLLRHQPRYGINAAAVPLAPGVATYIRITDIDDSGRFSPNPKVGVAHAGAGNYRLAPGELVFARTGASVGKSYLYDARDGELVYAGFLINVSPNPKLLNPKYLSLFAQSKEYWDWVARISVRSGQPGINGREYAQLLVPLPDIATQDAIAQVMTGIDDHISSLERMIAKKQAIKQGMMQQLLTGRSRLPGFTRSWTKARLGDFATMGSGGTPPSGTARFYGGGVPWVSISDMTNAGKYVRRTEKTLSQDGLTSSAARLYDERVVLYAMYASLGECALPIGRMASSQAILGILPDRRLDREFLYYYLVALRPKVKEMGQHGAQPNLNAEMVRRFSIELPSLDEQQAIASILSDADSELDKLEDRLEKAVAVKQGMMQQLLTGRTRLRPKGSAA